MVKIIGWDSISLQTIQITTLNTPLLRNNYCLLVYVLKTDAEKNKTMRVSLLKCEEKIGLWMGVYIFLKFNVLGYYLAIVGSMWKAPHLYRPIWSKCLHGAPVEIFNLQSTLNRIKILSTDRTLESHHILFEFCFHTNSGSSLILQYILYTQETILISLYYARKFGLIKQVFSCNYQCMHSFIVMFSQKKP